MTQKTNLNVEIDEETMKLAKAKAALENLKLTEYIEKLILENNKKLMGVLK